MPLTDIKIRQAKPADKPIKLADTAGLYLEVKPSGSKLWRYRYRIAGRENLFAIGEYPQVSLADARTVTAHDFRATASTRLHEMGLRSDFIELQLAHVERNRVRAAYNHADHRAERAAMMQSWADWLDSIAAAHQA